MAGKKSSLAMFLTKNIFCAGLPGGRLTHPAAQKQGNKHIHCSVTNKVQHSHLKRLAHVHIVQAADDVS
jgi:hypothetical protein